jgi:hypothetical protein
MSAIRGRFGSFEPVVGGAPVGSVPSEALALVTSLKGGRLPFIFWGGTLPLRVTGPELGAFFGSILGRVNGLKDETDGPRDNGLPNPPAGTPGPPTRCAGLIMSRECPFSGAGDTPVPLRITATVFV